MDKVDCRHLCITYIDGTVMACMDCGEIGPQKFRSSTTTTHARESEARFMSAQQYSEWLQAASPENSCGSKRRFSTEAEATQKAAVKASELGAMNAYRCIHCGSWHIGHRPDPAAFGIEITEVGV